MESIKHQPVNWVDGMNINKSHLISLENEITDKVRDVQQNQLNPISYGLLPISSDEDKPVDIWMNIDNQNNLSVHLNYCRAVTLGGIRIEITKALAEQMKLSAHELRAMVQLDGGSNEDLMIVITADPFNRIPIGNADPEENPPRKPYALPTYALSLIPEKDMGNGELGLYHLTIGKININQDKASLAEEYIPASTAVKSHPYLIETHLKQVRFLSDLELNCVRILQKIFTKQIKNNLAYIVTAICRQLIQLINHQSSNFNQVVPSQPPVHLLTHAASIARIIRNEIDIRTGVGAEQLLTYLSEWCGLNQASFENTLNDIIGFKYEHHQIRESVNSIEVFMSVIGPLFNKLAELDYIGKKSQSNIFVKEETLDNESKEDKSVWRGRFLAD